MTSARFRFTPSMQDGETLEALFVAREGLLTSAVDAIRDAGSGEHRAHRLFLGPRGAGKTHLIALIHHRMQALRAEGVRVQASWLVEDPWDIGSYAEFLDAILDARDDADARTSSDPEAELLASVAAGGPIVVLAENFDRILTAIGPDGQRKLRALLENSRPLLLMATATRLSDEIARQDVPFYGFFAVTHLEPFGVEDAAAMLVALAKHEKNQAQLELLDRPEASRRLATIAHLAGGQPRVWALLGPALQAAGIEDLVQNLLARVDDLTPYYQEQLAHLSPQEARVVRRMAAHDRPLTVRGISELAKLDQRSVGKTISDLRRRGWIRQYSSAITELADKRHSYYILAEPLARLAFQVKESRGEPIDLIVEFIAAWYDAAELPGGRIVDPYIRSSRRLDHIARVAHALADRTATATDHSVGKSAAGLVLADLDHALVDLEAGEPRTLLRMPPTIVDLVGHRLNQSSMSVTRIEVALLATNWGIDWRPNLASISPNNDASLFILDFIRATQEMHFGTSASVTAIVEPLIAALGPHNPLTPKYRSYIAVALAGEGDWDAGLRLMQQVSTDQEQVFGHDHQSTRDARSLVQQFLDRAEARRR